MKWVKIFDTWEKAAAALPDRDPFLLKLGNKDVTVVRKGDQLIAFEAYCPHQHEWLYQGTLTPGGEIVCPLHHYRFNLETGRECQERTRDLEFFPIQISDAVYLGINEK